LCFKFPDLRKYPNVGSNYINPMRSLILIILLSPCLKCLSQDTIWKYYPSNKIRSWQVKIDSNLIFEKSFYENGEVEGEVYAYLTSGKPLIKSFKSYYQTGTLKGIINDTVAIIYNLDGSVFQIAQYKNYKKHGITRTYRENKLSSEMEFVNDIQNGWVTRYDTSGDLLMRQYYHNGIQQGPANFYNNGILTKKIYYKNYCPYKAEYYNRKGKLIKRIIDKKSIWMIEGKPLGCV